MSVAQSPSGLASAAAKAGTLLAVAGLVSHCASSTDVSPLDATAGAGAGDVSPQGGNGATSSAQSGVGAQGSTTASGTGTGGAGGAAVTNCLEEGYTVGERYSVGDNCNFCDCRADGTTACTDRQCLAKGPKCTYDGIEHAYGERFPATDRCNECVCAASGLACTRRCPELPGEGAILLETLDDPCGDDMAFTPKTVLDGFPHPELTAPFDYDAEKPLYPEILNDTDVTLRAVYDGGFAVCRLQSPTQAALDIEIVLEWMTADGAFDEGFHTYLRRNNFGFVDAWTTSVFTPPGTLDGYYNVGCPHSNGVGFSAQWNADGTTRGDAFKVCETDLGLSVGDYATP